MKIANRNNLMKAIKILNGLERLCRSVAIVAPQFGKIADDIALANRHVAQARTAGKNSNND